MIDIQCPTCKHKLLVDDSYAGRSGRCKKCGGMVEVPATTSTEGKAASPGFAPIESPPDSEIGSAHTRDARSQSPLDVFREATTGLSMDRRMALCVSQTILLAIIAIVLVYTLFREMHYNKLQRARDIVDGKVHSSFGEGVDARVFLNFHDMKCSWGCHDW